MKKLNLLLLICLFSQLVSAQITGGGEPTNVPSTANNVPGGGFMYLRGGVSLPSGDLKASDFSTGYMLEFGVMPFFINKETKVNVGMIIADDIVFYGSNSDAPSTGTKDFLMTLGLKLGPALTYSPVDKVNFDVFYGFHPEIPMGTFMGVDQTDVNITLFNTLGFNFRYSGLIVGLSFDSGKLKLMTDTDGGSIKLSAPTTRLTIGFKLNKRKK